MASPHPAHPHLPVPVADDQTAVFDLTVVIVNYNVREFLEQALRSVERASGGVAVETFVVDNNSVDGSVEMVRQCFPDVHVIANRENVGFSQANNQAIRRARGRYLLILNPDTIVQEDTLATAVRFLDEHPEAGALGCTILNPDGTFAPESRRAFPTPRVAFYRMIGLSKLFPRSPRFGRYNMTYLPDDAVAEVDALSGSCMFVRRSALYYPQPEADGQAEADLLADLPPESHGAGLFDEDFFMYGEDLDWCYRIQQAGWKIYYTPETQIIHYKGESTKKGELRYVRLFYGAMIRFAEKHFHGRYSSLFIALLRLGVVARAGLSVVANAARRWRPLLVDVALVLGIVVGLGLLRSAQTGVAFSGLFYGLVAPVYALATVGGIAALGGYLRTRLARVRPVWWGATVGLLGVAALAFFVKALAFSRAVVLAAFVVSLVVLTAVRLGRKRRHAGARRAVLVGAPSEACRLHAMLAAHPRAPFSLAGYVEVGEGVGGDGAPPPEAGPRRLGTQHGLRDLVRLNAIDDVVFAADSLSNRAIFAAIDRLRDLPVQFRILAEGREHIIGKASIDDLSAPTLLEADEALGVHRSPAARRAFDVGGALVGLTALPFVALGALGGSRKAARLAVRLRRLPGVLAGRLRLVGHAPDGPAPPAELRLEPGVFAIEEVLTTPTPDEVARAHVFYAHNQSASLDSSIIVRSIYSL